jgi:peptide-methionine (R)-S-oxide reductase
MKRQIVIGIAFLSACTQAQAPIEIRSVSPPRKDKVVLSDAEWKKRLTREQYVILRNKGTEAAFCGRFYDNHQKGVYVCAGCGLPLFDSTVKFDSGTGWPSFYKPIARDAVWARWDLSHGMRRLEVLCARCDGHLGHVFDDAPQTPTGLRFCLNSDAMKFQKK